MTLDQLTDARLAPPGSIASAIGSVPSPNLKSVVDTATDAVDLDAVADTLADAAAAASDALGDLATDVATATGAATAAGGRSLLTGARRAARFARRHPRLSVSSLALAAAIVALVLMLRRSDHEEHATSDLRVAA